MNSLHFLHVDPASKSFNMTMATGKSEAAYLAEASKCALVCANCHGEIEAGITESPPAPGMSPSDPVFGSKTGADQSDRRTQPQLRLILDEEELERAPAKG
jgi:hypothetical protein